MGQKISALKRKVRSVKKYSQRKSDSDGYLSQVTSSKADCAVLSPKVPDSKEDAQCQSKTNGSLSQPASFKGECAVPLSRGVDSEEDAQRQSNTNGSPSQTTSLEGECAVLSLPMTNNKEDTPHQSNADESLLSTSSSEDKYAALSLNMTDSWEDTQSQIDIDEISSPTTSSRDDYAALSSSMMNSCKNTRSQINIDKTFSPTTSLRDDYAALSSSMINSCKNTQSQIDIDEVLSRTTSDDELSSMTDSWEDTQSQIDIDKIFSRTTSNNKYTKRLTTLLDFHQHPRRHMGFHINTDLDKLCLQAESRMNKRRSVQSGNIRNFSEDSHRIRESETDTIPEGLLKLSTDLILEIADYLPPSSYMSLSYTCRRIRNGMGASIEYVLGDKVPISRWKPSVPSIEMRNIRLLERLEWRRLLDRDGKVPSSQAYCSRCFCSHDRSLFSTRSLAEPSTRRRCVGSAGRVWICPHLSLDYRQAHGLRIGANVGKAVGCDGRFVSNYGRFYRVCSMDFSNGSFLTWWPIMKMPAEGVPSNQEVEEALRPMKATVCPHLRLNDACVARAYLKDLEFDLKGSIFYPKLRRVCTFCGMSVQFMIQGELYGPKTLILVIMRRLEWMRSCTDRAWICQVADPADPREYEEAWHAANVECCRKVGSVVDRFLLS